jgi:hypothetical protein
VGGSFVSSGRHENLWYVKKHPSNNCGFNILFTNREQQTGYMTTTQIKFIISVYDDASNYTGDQSTADQQIKELLAEIHRIYVEFSLNPFSAVEAPISSARFDAQVSDCVSAFNSKSFV